MYARFGVQVVDRDEGGVVEDDAAGGVFLGMCDVVA